MKEADPPAQLPSRLKADKFPDGGGQTFGDDTPIRCPMSITNEKDDPMNTSPGGKPAGEDS
ncbi:MAG: hypothetical protein H8D37_06195 [Chloroflexi bacterium]|nr:hypothetical protein [Chloroflexota bacterium]